MGKDQKGKELGNGMSQRKDGKYCARYIDRFGKRISIYNTNLRELKLELNKSLYENTMQMNVIDDKITLNDWFDKWINILKYGVIRANTKRHYLDVYLKHIKPTLGHFKLKDITQLQIKGLLKVLKELGYQFETQNRVKIMLTDMFDKAMIDNFVQKNPVKGIKVNRDEIKEIRVLSPEEQVDFFECSKGTFYDNLFTVAVSTGLRPGELCALTWDDVDFEKMEIDVNKTLVYQKLEGDIGKTYHIEPPKTNNSYRKVPINRQCELALKKQKMQKNVIMQKSPKVIDEDLKKFLFTTKYNTPINAVDFSGAIRKIIDEINLTRDATDEFEYFSAHCFRHTFATRCFESGIQPKTVQKFLGHATLDMTMNLYTHVLEDHKKEEMKKLESSLDVIQNNSHQYVEKKYNNFINNQESNQSKIIDFCGVRMA